MELTVVEEIDLSLNLNLSSHRDAWDWWFFRLRQAGVQKTFKRERPKIFRFHPGLVFRLGLFIPPKCVKSQNPYYEMEVIFY